MGNVIMHHPSSAGTAHTTQQAFDEIWAAKGWILDGPVAPGSGPTPAVFIPDPPDAAEGTTLVKQDGVWVAVAPETLPGIEAESARARAAEASLLVTGIHGGDFGDPVLPFLADEWAAGSEWGTAALDGVAMLALGQQFLGRIQAAPTVYTASAGSAPATLLAASPTPGRPRLEGYQNAALQFRGPTSTAIGPTGWARSTHDPTKWIRDFPGGVGNTYLMEPSSSDWWAFLVSQVVNAYSLGFLDVHWDNIGLYGVLASSPLYEVDNTGAKTAWQTANPTTRVYPRNPSTGVAYTQSEWLIAWRTALTSVVASLAAQGIIPVSRANGLGNGGRYFDASGGGNAPTSLLIDSGTPFKAGVAELWLRFAADAIGSFRPEHVATPSSSSLSWETDVNMLLDAGARGVGVAVMVKLFTTSTTAQKAQWKRYALASFLLAVDPWMEPVTHMWSFEPATVVKNRTTPLPEIHDQGYAHDPVIDTLSPGLGPPLDYFTNVGEARSNGVPGDGTAAVYVRNFAAPGIVIVNPTTLSKTYTLPAGNYQPVHADLVPVGVSGTVSGSITVAANEAYILQGV